MPLTINTLYIKSKNAVLNKNKLHVDTPKRKDGSQHWVFATLADEHYFDTQTEFTEEEVDFYYKSTGSGNKTSDYDIGLSSLQLDSRATMKIGINRRDFDYHQVSELSRIAEIIRKAEAYPG
jgi:hypothetical protein